MITHAEAENENEKSGQDATALEQRMTALLKHDLYRSCIYCSYF